MARREHQDPSVLERDSAAGREWYIRYRVKVMDIDESGRPKIRRIEKHVALGLCARMTKRQAEREKDKILREVNQQVYTVQSQIPFSRVDTFLANHVPTLAVPSQKTYRQHIHAYIGPAFGELRLCQVDTLQCESLFRAMEAKRLARKTRYTCKGILKAIFGCCRRWGYLDLPQSPVKDANIGGGPRVVRPSRIPSLEDVGRLMEACSGDVPLLIETLYTTGMRISEAAGLIVSDLDFALGFVAVSRRDCRGSVGDTKSDQGTRELPLGSVAVALQQHVLGKGPTDRVFLWAGEPIVDNQLLGKTITPIMEDLGIKFPGFGWHSFRRLHLSLMSKRGLSLFELRQQAGHADVRTTQRYIVDERAGRDEAARGLPKLVIVKKKSA